MRIVVIGASGTIGSAIVSALSAAEHEVVSVSKKSTPLTADISDSASLSSMFRLVGKVDAIVSAAGQARYKPLAELSDDDFDFTLRNKLMGQVNIVRYGLEYVRDGGSITLTAGYLSRNPAPGSAAVSLVNAALEGFARAAACEAPRGIRVNVVSPPWVTETLEKMGADTKGGMPAAAVAKSYVESVTGTASGRVIDPQP
jgi:NAD(P)-dependent dehydrogenase (short-subunit alcohol dehydrogenase family)